MTAIPTPEVAPPIETPVEPRVTPSRRPGGVTRAIRRLLAGDIAEATSAPIAHVAVTAVAAVLYLVNLTVSGYANTYYSAAALAASQSWTAWFFGSFDAANFITVDKPPLATMLMGLSVRLFGLNSWSILLPEALAGIATVALLFLIVRRSFGVTAAFIASLVMAVTPAAVLIFRFNNPDALLTLLLVAAAGAFLRALETGRLRWVVMAAMLVGLAFNTKYLQAYLVLPAFALTYLIAAPGGIRRRVVGLLVAGVTVLASSLWWVAIVELLPTAARPYIGGSSSNSALELLLGYDGLQRIFGFIGDGFAGRDTVGPGPGGGGGGFGGLPGLLRMFNDQFGGQVAWLIPMSLVGLAGGLWLRGRAPRTDTKRAAYLMWGLWLLTHVAVFSLMSGIVHTYYVVVLAPPIGALVGGGIVDLWAAARGRIKARAVLAAGVLGSAGVAWWLLARTPEFVSWLGPAVVVAGVIASLAIAAGASTRSPVLIGGLALAVLLAAPAAYAVDTMTTAYAGGDPKAGPATLDRFGGPGGLASDAFRDGGFRAPPTGLGPGAFPGGTRPGDGGFAGGPGSESADSALTAYLLAHKGTATWVAATTSAMSAGVLELATREPVMAMGGFSGSDPAPTLDQIKAYVASGQLRYVVVSGAGGFGAPGGGNSTTAAIDAWVQSVGTAVDYGGSGGTLYDLSGVAP